MTDSLNEDRIKAILHGMRRAERRRAERRADSSDLLSLIDGAAYGAPEDAQRVLAWLAHDGSLAHLQQTDLHNVGDTICVAWNGCGSDLAKLSQWLRELRLTDGRGALQALRDGDSATLLATALAAFPG
ncbi:hypothetical protein J7373_02410 [Xanthomonas sp. A2111]|uniref:Uncharacterized protein n=1 Tax=Xanthomonas hawaiiensis TaxID=3003247 RepID=A0ABU2I9K3_9XANT|nr:hypothetical protein [Xanthomonas sp. A2111]MBO9827097.1 hypothetical protein [Xanthomonas sp. A2111]MDS9994814.1 hypothetical protein [Xanthomonas sp. A2111]